MMGRGGARLGAGRKPGSGKEPSRGRFVYVVHEVENDSVCKVGIASEPTKRLSALQVSNWRRLRLAFVFEGHDDNHGHSIESLVHQRLSGTHVSGEWFRISPERASREIEKAAADLTIIKINQDE